MKKCLLPILVLLLGCSTIPSERDNVISRTLEFRQYSPVPATNGETDLKGKTSVFDNAQRIAFLKTYCDYASAWYGDSQLDSKVAPEQEIRALIASIKPQPLPETRTVKRLEQWQALGVREGAREKELEALKVWQGYAGTSVADGVLTAGPGLIRHRLAKPMAWRFEAKWRAKADRWDECAFALSQDGKDCVCAGFDADGKLFCVSAGERRNLAGYQKGKWMEFHVEVDVQEREFNLYVDGARLVYGAALADNNVAQADTFAIKSSGTVQVDSVYALNYVQRKDDVSIPYEAELLADETFDIRPLTEGWTLPDYDDRSWKPVVLPYAHGGVRFAGEDLYLRKRVKVGKFAKAVLRIEALDPSGEVYVNGKKAAVIDGRYPVRLDITEHLRPETENLIALKVDHRLLPNPMHHCCADLNIGWFAGRAQLELSDAVSVERVLVHTSKLEADKAFQTHAILFENRSREPFSGSVTIHYAPWTPREGRAVAKQSFDITVPAENSVEHAFTMCLEKPQLWNWRAPCLYKVRAELRDASGKLIDDSVLTTGIRTVEQAGERLLVNGQEEMLNGVQIMGFRMPVETLARYNRCATLEQLAEELIMTRKCGSNLLRVHVHAAEATADGINDPRIPEMCDQLGIMLAWQTPSWIREGAWEAIDFTNFAAYARQVYNSPSIVNWELSNHPNKFKGKGLKYSTDFVESTMRCVLAVDSSRLITPTTFWQHTLIKDDRGTTSKDGEKIKAPDLYTHPLCTRGTQDAVTGYGADWGKLRNWPQGFSLDVLQNQERPFFNWEHEESIAQPNWELSKGKPWHLFHSYEHGYDVGSIGRKLDFGEWRASQGFQAFAAYESMKKQRLHGVDGFSWCCLRGGANSGTYKKPLIDSLGHAKLAWHIHKTVFQRVFAGSDNVDVVYGPDDRITPVIMNLDEAKTVDLQIIVRNTDGQEVQRFTFENIALKCGRNETRLEPIKVDFPKPGTYAIEYLVTAR